MPLITFTNKVDSRIINVPAINKIISSDVNQLKDGVNNNEIDIATNATAIALNTAKVSFDSASSNRLAGTSGTNTGDQDLSGLQLTSQKDAVSGYAGLDGSGKINPSQLPALAITDTFVVASQSSMLALTAQVGDIAVRTDVNETFILRVDGSTVLANWQKLQTPTDAVSSVFGRVGVVTAQNNDYTFAQINKTTSSLADLTTRDFSDLQNKPTTISGYGITDAYTKTETDGKYLLNTTDTLTGTLNITSILRVDQIDNGYTLNLGTTSSGSIFATGRIFTSNNIYGNVVTGATSLIAGSGNTSSIFALDVFGTSNFTGAATFASSVTANGRLDLKVTGIDWNETNQGTSKGSIHLDPQTTTDNAGNAITFGASDNGNGETAQAGIYVRTDSNYGSKMYFSTTDSYAAGSKTALTLESDQSATFASTVKAGGYKSSDGTAGITTSFNPNSIDELVFKNGILVEVNSF